MESGKHVGAEAGTGEEAKLPGTAQKASEKPPASYPIILRSYQPVADLDERLSRIFAVLSLPPVVEGARTDFELSDDRLEIVTHEREETSEHDL